MGVWLTVGALGAGVAELAAEVARPLALLVGAIACHVALAPALEAPQGRLLKVLVKVPAHPKT